MERRLTLAGIVEAVRDEGTLPSVADSLALHLLVIALGLFLIALNPPAVIPPRPPIIFADLVPLAEGTVSPDAPEHGPIPQQRAPEETGKPDATAVPVPTDRKPPAARAHAERDPAKSANTRSGKSPTERKPSSGEDQQAAGGDLTARLEAFAKAHLPPSQLPPDPRAQDGQGTSNVTVADRNARRGAVATYGVKDFIRAQIARRWYIDRASKPYAMAQAQHWVAILHLRIGSDGTVTDAEVTMPADMRNNATFNTFALSVRNAALLSSPLELLPDTYELVKDMELDFPISSLPP